jgi:hypothetical protein
MAATIPTVEPDRITAGDTGIWKITVSDYPASEGWTLSYALVKRGATPADDAIAFSATASGDDYSISVDTTSWPAGDYEGQGYVTKAGERHKVRDVFITVEPNFAVGKTGDVRSHARKVLDCVEAVIEKRATQEILEWTVEGTQLRKATVSDLLMLRDRYKAIVNKEEARSRVKAGKASGRRILTRFVRPGSGKVWPPGFIR